MGNVNPAQIRSLRPSDAGLEIRLFGPMTIRKAGQTIAIPAKKVRALLAYLVQREGVEIARTTLTGLLWGERDEAQARASLRQSLSELRTALGESAEALVANKESITWRTNGAWIDTKVLEAATAGPSEARDEAVSLFKGDFLEGFAIDEPGFDQWLTTERERLRLVVSSMHAGLMKAAEQQGRLEKAVNHGLGLLTLDPLQEQVHRALMRLYAAQGRPDAALAQYDRLEHELSSQLDVKPDAETEALFRSIRSSRRESAPRAQGKPAAASPPDKPSVTVLPFVNLSSDREHGFFADGLTQDIIAALSQIKDLSLISNNAKGVRAENTDIAKELGVRFILEGSVRAAGKRIRVTAHLIDSSTAGHVWSERYEGDVGDIFAVQDQITHAIALAMQVKLAAGEMARFWEGQTRNLRAWEKMVAARDAFLRFNRTANAHARHLLEEAISIDPNYTGAIVLHGMTYWWDARFNKSIAVEHSLRLAEVDSQKSLAVNPDLGIAHMLRGGIAWLRNDHDQAIKLVEQAVRFAPSDAHSVAFLAMLYMYGGENERAMVTLKLAMRLCPQYPSWYTYYLALIHMWMSNHAAALEAAETYLGQEPDEPFAFAILAMILAFQGRKTEAAEMIRRLRERFADFSMTEIHMSQHYRERANMDKVVNALREAGLPD